MIDSIFHETGPLAKTIPGYESRPQQQEMAQAVERTLKEGRTLLVEAGTGTGKSLAYLIPALFFAVQQKKKVIVSTHTIHLQEQLLHKDLPILRKALPFSFRAVLVKGRGNYVSLRRLRKAREDALDLFERAADFLELERLQTWTLTSEDGSLQDLSPAPSPSLWGQAQSDTDNCMGRKCSTYSRCFYYSARRQIEQADLLIVNHALFFSDLALKGSEYAILPQADCIILDEAHALEEVATERLGFTLSKSHIRYFLTRLYHPKKRKGILASHRESETLIRLIEEGLRGTDRLFAALREKLEKRQSVPLTRSLSPNGGEGGVRGSFRVHQPYWVENPLYEILMEIHHGLGQMRGGVDTQEEELELSSWMKKVSELQGQLDAFFEQSLPDYVYWIETGSAGPEKTAICAAPVAIHAILKQHLFEKNPRVILTSATLAAGGDFSYIRERLGIEQADELILDSPFDYQNQVTLHLPQPLLRRGGFQTRPYDEEYLAILAGQIQYYLKKTDGRAFVLFTNYSLMNQTYEALLPWLIENQMDSFKQGNGIPRHKMLQAFRESSKGVLLGTDSFWSGVDIQGEALSNVIITKLPFAVPDHPIIEARCEKIRESGGDPFQEYSLPQAVMKFKQGFGRLIRTKSDRGIVVVLDPRILTKGYGKSFLEALPECRIVRN